MKIAALIVIAASVLCLSETATAQVPADLVAVSGVPTGGIFAPHTPAGVVIIGEDIWVGDEAQVCATIYPSTQRTPTQSIPGS